MPDIKDILNSVSNTASISARAESEKAHYDLSDDFTLPDYMPAIEKVLRVSADIGKNGKYVHANSAEMLGEVIYKVLYLGDNKMPRTVSLSASFEHTKELPSDDECTIMFFPYIDEISFKVTGPRKITLKSKVGFTTDVICEVSAEPKITGGTCHIERLWRNIDHHKMLCFSDDENHVSEDIEIPAEFPAVGEILNCNITPYLTECRAAGDQINTSYGVNVSVLYTAEAFEDAEESSLPKYVRFDKKIPLQVALSAPGVTPEYECYAEMRTGEIEAKADINNLGEMRVIELDFDMPVKVSCFKNVCDRIVCDAFSTDCDIQLNRRRIECKKLIKNTVSNFSDRILIPSDDGKINELLDLGIITVPGEITVKKNKLQMDGNCYFSAIINDENSEIRALNGEKAIRFECECPTPLGESEHLCNTEVSDVRCRIDGATLCIDFEITVSMMVFDKAYEEFVSAINVEKKSEDCPKHTGLRMYYPNSDETLWNIAKKYRVGIDTLIHENSLAEASDPRSNIPTEKHVLIIP